MLNLEDIVVLAEDAWNVRIKNWNAVYRRGLCCYDLHLILLYPQFCTGNKDFYVTIAHEFHHAAYPEMNEVETEERSLSIVENHIEVINYAKDIFEIMNWEDYVVRF